MTKHILGRIRSKLRKGGFLGLCATTLRIIYPNKASSFNLCRELINDRSGLEIGGPSGVFQQRGIMPIYGIVRSLDNCNFSSETEWEGKIREGKTFRFHSRKEPGHQFVGEATNLQMIPSETYDFVLSSHVLEHSANPIAALSEWLRVLKLGGVLVILVPHKDGTFDHRRPVTSLQHLKEDFECQMPETDDSHFREIIALHDLSRDPEAGTVENFKLRCAMNFQNRCVHHHVFDTNLVVNLLDHMGVKLLAVETLKPFHILAVAQKYSAEIDTNNHALISSLQNHLPYSPFPTDKLATRKLAG